MEPCQEQASPHPALPLLHQWLQLSEAETCSIQAGDWQELDRIQNAKAVLQSQFSKKEKNENTTEIREMADILIAIEAKNRDLLNCNLMELKKRMDNDFKSLNTMHNVQRAYVHAPLNDRQSTSRLQQLT